MAVPIEIIEEILTCLLPDSAKLSFSIATLLRLTNLQSNCLSYVAELSPEVCCTKGLIGVLHLWRTRTIQNPDTSSKPFLNQRMTILNNRMRITKLKPSVFYIDRAFENGRTDVLDFFMEFYFDDMHTLFRDFPTHFAVVKACKRGRINVLNWWKDSSLHKSYNIEAMDAASLFGQVDVLEWWRTSGLQCRYSVSAIDDASGSGLINVLDWWKSSGLPLLWSRLALIEVEKYLPLMEQSFTHEVSNFDRQNVEKHLPVLHWWIENGFELKVPTREIEINLRRVYELSRNQNQ